MKTYYAINTDNIIRLPFCISLYTKPGYGGLLIKTHTSGGRLYVLLC